jgi:hypothetical protein
MIRPCRVNMDEAFGLVFFLDGYGEKSGYIH